MAEYYAQRASAGLIVTEGTQISPQGKGYSHTPGIHTDEQVRGWARVTRRVHEAGGRMFAQLWHVGRMSHHRFHDGSPPVAPSAVAADAAVWIADTSGGGRMVPTSRPRALTVAEIRAVVGDYAAAARNAIRAGFDGVEIHGANGYLIDQFLRVGSNRRTDRYGGPAVNRVRFLLEVADAVAAGVGAERVGVRLAPRVNDRDDELLDTLLLAAARLAGRGLAYLHLAEADWDDAPVVPLDFRRRLRRAFDGRIIVAGNYDRTRGEQILDQGLADLVAFGRPFVANPDLPHRLRHGVALAAYDPDRLYGGGARGYTDYPALAPAGAAEAVRARTAG